VVDRLDLEFLMEDWGQQVNDPTLLAHWSLDQESGASAVDSVHGHLAASAGGLYLGVGSTLATGSYWSGPIDDVRIYSRVVKPQVCKKYSAQTRNGAYVKFAKSTPQYMPYSQSATGS
jgi:hypothetical protein